MIDVRSGRSAGPPELLTRQAVQHEVALPEVPTDDPGWILVEHGFILAREHEIEALFAIGNGYVGTRGSLAEGSALSAAATLVAGIFRIYYQRLRRLQTGLVWQLQLTDIRFGSIGATTSSTDASSTCGRAFSGGSGDIETKLVGSHSYGCCVWLLWPIAISWFNVRRLCPKITAVQYSSMPH